MSETYNGCDTGEYIAVPGPRGPQGQQGIQGEPGPTGPQGPQGIAGPMGPVGCQGPKGDRGPAGPQGPQGEQGIPGLNGRDGARGPEGPRGCTGASGKVAFEKLRPEQIEMLRGPQGPQGERGPQGLRGFNGSPGMQGPTGATGPVGPQGPRGDRGEIGPAGPMGPQGPRGATGAPGKNGGTTTTDHVATDGVWSSKNVVDYSLHGQTEWTNKLISWASGDQSHKVTGTANGYAKNSKIHGYTMTNYSTMQKKEKLEIIKQPYSTEKNRVLEVYNKTKSGNVSLVEDHWTLIYTLDNIRLFESSGSETPWAGIKSEVIVHSEKARTDHSEGGDVMPIITLPTNAVNGVIKQRLIIPGGQRITKIEIKPIVSNDERADESLNGTSVTYTVKDVLLLRDNYEFKIPPRYFYGTRGVGTATNEPGKYNIEVESRNKNLINEDDVIENFYLGVESSGSERKTVRWSSAVIPGSVASFLIYCKPETEYTFSSVVIDEARARLVVCEYDDDPFNGEPATITHAQTTENMRKGPERLTFTTSSHTNIIAIYLGNYESGERNINTIHDKIQLEEGPIETSYEPYRSMKKTIKINKQLNHGEYLYWNKNKNKYFIHEQPIPGQFKDTETDIIVEELIHTYDGTTYVYVNSKIPSQIEAEFPLKAHNDYFTKEEINAKNAALTSLFDKKLKENYYTRKAWALQDKDTEEDLNFLGFPNGVRIQWKRVLLNSDNTHVTVDFKALGSIYTVMATPYNAQTGDSKSFVVVTRVKEEEGSVGNPWPRIDVWAKSIPGVNVNFPVYAQLLAIGDNETYQPSKEQEQH